MDGWMCHTTCILLSRIVVFSSRLWRHIFASFTSFSPLLPINRLPSACRHLVAHHVGYGCGLSLVSGLVSLLNGTQITSFPLFFENAEARRLPPAHAG